MYGAVPPPPLHAFLAYAVTIFLFIYLFTFYFLCIFQTIYLIRLRLYSCVCFLFFLPSCLRSFSVFSSLALSV
jgi:hypothetical protein